jgi:hypothetical protein
MQHVFLTLDRCYLHIRRVENMQARMQFEELLFRFRTYHNLVRFNGNRGKLNVELNGLSAFNRKGANDTTISDGCHKQFMVTGINVRDKEKPRVIGSCPAVCSAQQDIRKRDPFPGKTVGNNPAHISRLSEQGRRNGCEQDEYGGGPLH